MKTIRKNQYGIPLEQWNPVVPINSYENRFTEDIRKAVKKSRFVEERQ